MTAAGTSFLIDSIARELRDVLTEEAADAIATQIAGQLQSRYLICPLPEVDEGATTRAELAGLGIPGLFSKGATS